MTFCTLNVLRNTTTPATLISIECLLCPASSEPSSKCDLSDCIWGDKRWWSEWWRVKWVATGGLFCVCCLIWIQTFLHNSVLCPAVVTVTWYKKTKVVTKPESCNKSQESSEQCTGLDFYNLRRVGTGIWVSLVAWNINYWGFEKFTLCSPKVNCPGQNWLSQKPNTYMRR